MKKHSKIKSKQKLTNNELSKTVGGIGLQLPVQNTQNSSIKFPSGGSGGTPTGNAGAPPTSC